MSGKNEYHGRRSSGRTGGRSGSRQSSQRKTGQRRSRQSSTRPSGSRQRRSQSGRGGILTLLVLLVLLPFMAYGVKYPDSKAGEVISRMQAQLETVTITELGETGALSAEDETVHSFEVHFIDVGQGDATLIKCGDHTMLIDTGEDDKGTAIQYYLTKQGVEELDYLILTHPDSDHIGSADVIITKFSIEHVLMPDYEKDNSTYRKMMEALDYRRMKAEIVTTEEMADSKTSAAYTVGSSFYLGEAVCTILGPVQQYDEPNNSSIALLIRYGDTGFLFTGDAEKQAERDILEYCADNGISLQADVYKAGHHGSSTSSGDVLLEAVAPAWTVISCGKGNSYGHPHEETLEHFRMRGIQIYRTDEQGSIVAYSDGRDITWKVVGKSEE